MVISVNIAPHLQPLATVFFSRLMEPEQFHSWHQPTDDPRSVHWWPRPVHWSPVLANLSAANWPSDTQKKRESLGTL